MKRNIRNNSRLIKVLAREILDSRGNPTVEVEMSSKNHSVREQVPSGASTGKYEAKELRDGALRYNGKGVLKAVSSVKFLSKAVYKMKLCKQDEFDKRLLFVDTTKVKMGANAIIGMSLCYAKLSAKSTGISIAEFVAKIFGTKKMKMPVPYMNVINGGMHAGGGASFQEHMLVPHGKNFSESLRIGAETYHELKKIIKKKYGSSAVNVGDEGGFVPAVKTAEKPFDLMQKAVDNLGYEKKIKFAMDSAANSFFNVKTKKYTVCGKNLTTDKLYELYLKLVKKYPIKSIEDPFYEHHFDFFSKLMKKIGKKVQIVGDDITVSQPQRVKMALDGKEMNCLLLKPNQVGTLSETLKSAKIAFEGGANVMVSHRSGETESTFIADLAVGIGCGQIKTGAPCRGERTAKYNQLLRLEENLKLKIAK